MNLNKTKSIIFNNMHMTPAVNFLIHMLNLSSTIKITYLFKNYSLTLGCEGYPIFIKEKIVIYFILLF